MSWSLETYVSTLNVLPYFVENCFSFLLIGVLLWQSKVQESVVIIFSVGKDGISDIFELS